MEDSFLSFGFIQKALLAGLLSGIGCGVAGVFVVLMRVAFVGVCISHAALAGALVAVFLGFAPMPGAILLSLCAAAAISPLANKGSLSPETATGIVFSVMLSVSMLALGLLPGARSEGLSLIWGNILTTSTQDIYFLGLIAILIVGFVVLFFKEIQAVLCHRDNAAAVGIPVKAITQIMLLILALVVASGIKSIGGLLIYSLIISPAAAAYQLSYKLKYIMLLSAIFGVIACWTGLWLSTILHWPSGATIVLLATIILVFAVTFSPKKNSIVRE